jgi:hypothetical protein
MYKACFKSRNIMIRKDILRMGNVAHWREADDERFPWWGFQRTLLSRRTVIGLKAPDKHMMMPLLVFGLARKIRMTALSAGIQKLPLARLAPSPFTRHLAADEPCRSPALTHRGLAA